MAPRKVSEIPTAPAADLDLSLSEHRAEWERRVMLLAARRIEQARERLEGMGIIDAHGDLVSRELPPDMRAESGTTLETG